MSSPSEPRVNITEENLKRSLSNLTDKDLITLFKCLILNEEGIKCPSGCPFDFIVKTNAQLNLLKQEISKRVKENPNLLIEIL